jgi:hypothetical protein
MFLLGKRRIQHVTTGYYINAPIEWIRNFNLIKGSEVRLYLDPTGRLIIEPLKISIIEDQKDNKDGRFQRTYVDPISNKK